MHAIGCLHYGGPSVLELLDLPEPHAGPGEVRIRVHAVAVNPADTIIRSGGAHGVVHGPPYLPGIEAAGVLDETGSGVRPELQIGSKVMSMVNPTRPAGGSYAEYLVVPETWVSLAPSTVSLEQASTVPAAGLTARIALDALALPDTATVLISGAAGVVGGYAVELAKADGLRVLADASPADRNLVRTLGTDVVLDRGAGLAAAVRTVEQAGVDAVIDTAVIGAPLVDAVRDGGAFVVVRHSPATTEIHTSAARRRITVHEVIVNDYDGNTAALNRLRVQVEQGTLTPRIATVLPVAEAGTAHRHLEGRGVRGRIVLAF